MTSYKEKWNQGKRYAHYFEIPFYIATDKAWEDVTREELWEVVNQRMQDLRDGVKEEIEGAVFLIDTEDYDANEEGEGDESI